MVEPDYLSNQFLVAMPTLEDPNFHQTVTYVCEHSDQGALGVIINRPMEVTLAEIFNQMDIDAGRTPYSTYPVFLGGPVQQERGFVIHDPPGDWDSTLRVTDEVGLTTSRDILAAMAEGGGPDRVLVALGYAGWAAGQLEAELSANSWLTVPADPTLIFDVPADQRYAEAARLIGVDLERLSGDSGHA